MESRISIGVFEARSNAGDAVDHLRRAIADAEKANRVKALIATGTAADSSLVTIICHWRSLERPFEDESETKDHREFARRLGGDNGPLRAVDLGRFTQFAHEHRCEEEETGLASGQGKEWRWCCGLSVGDVVGVRRIYTEISCLETVAYACVAVTKSYFEETTGMRWVSFFKANNGCLVLGLSQWDSVDAACAVLRGSPAEAFWCDHSVSLCFDVCRVVYVSACPPPNQVY